MTSSKPSVALVGAGAMGGAMFKGWLQAGSIDTSTSAVFDPKPPQEVADLCAAHGLALNPDIAAFSVDAVICAVKPQAADKALPAYAPLAREAVAVSIMAGKSVSNISSALGNAPRIVRAMPNLPAAIGCGVTGLYANDSVDQARREMIDGLMQAVGETVWVESESDIDAVTAVSGSGPAYFFLMTQALAEAGEALGLSKDAAAKLARATSIGAGALLDNDARAPADMRRAVTSPGGTTEAALSVLDGDEKQLRKLLKEAVLKAARRAGELTD